MLDRVDCRGVAFLNEGNVEAVLRAGVTQELPNVRPQLPTWTEERERERKDKEMGRIETCLMIKVRRWIAQKVNRRKKQHCDENSLIVLGTQLPQGS